VEGEYGGNTIHMYINGKIGPVETIPAKGGGEIKDNHGGDEFNYDTLEELL
jgi:hypothetical protein